MSWLDTKCMYSCVLRVTHTKYKHAQGYQPAFKLLVQMYQAVWDKDSISSEDPSEQQNKGLKQYPL